MLDLSTSTWFIKHYNIDILIFIYVLLSDRYLNVLAVGVSRYYAFIPLFNIFVYLLNVQVLLNSSNSHQKQNEKNQQYKSLFDSKFDCELLSAFLCPI